MGRYYNGDIEGKFWFGVQASNDADFFGVTGSQSYLEYMFDKEDLPGVQKGIKRCKDFLGEYEKKIFEFFENRESYNDKELAEYLEVVEPKARELLMWYARLKLGYKIEKCLIEFGQCNFEAEL